MKQAAKIPCQVRQPSGKIITLARGEVIDYPEGHPHLRPIEGPMATEVDFLTATKDELQVAKWKFSEANGVMEKAYGKSLFKEEGTKKSEIISQILDIRYRSVDASDLTRLD